MLLKVFIHSICSNKIFVVFSQKGYGKECDFWSLGGIMFECLIGYPPFCSETAHDTYKKIINWKDNLYIPDDVHLSREAEDVIMK